MEWREQTLSNPNPKERNSPNRTLTEIHFKWSISAYTHANTHAHTEAQGLSIIRVNVISPEFERGWTSQPSLFVFLFVKIKERERHAHSKQCV